MEIGAKRAELGGFLDSPSIYVNARRQLLCVLKQWLIIMVQYYLEKHQAFGME
jgi:hypothetical protein